MLATNVSQESTLQGPLTNFALRLQSLRFFLHLSPCEFATCMKALIPSCFQCNSIARLLAWTTSLAKYTPLVLSAVFSRRHVSRCRSWLLASINPARQRFWWYWVLVLPHHIFGITVTRQSLCLTILWLWLLKAFGLFGSCYRSGWTKRCGLKPTFSSTGSFLPQFSAKHKLRFGTGLFP